jgi:hypothetical protein
MLAGLMIARYDQVRTGSQPGKSPGAAANLRWRPAFVGHRGRAVLTAMAAIYWLMGYPQAKIVDWIHRNTECANHGFHPQERRPAGEPLW